VSSRALILRRILADRRSAALGLAAVLGYLGLSLVFIFVAGALMRDGSLPDSFDVRVLPVTPAKWLEVYGASPVAIWNFPLAWVSLAWEPHPEWWRLTSALLFISLGFAARMLVIAVLGGLVILLLVSLLRRLRASVRRDLSGAVGGVGLASIGSSVGAPMAALMGG
jgi:hypothetical protein